MTITRYTKRKFYGKWLYKLSIDLAGVGIFRLKSLHDVLMFCTSEYDDGGYGHSVKDKAYKNKREIGIIANLLLSWPEDQWAKRLEYNQLDIYTNNTALYKQALSVLGTIVTHCYEPNAASMDILASASNFAVKNYPHKRYKHRVYLLPHKMPNDIEIRTAYLVWLESQSPRIMISEAVKKWFIDTRWNWDRRYIYVEDQQTLLLLKLRSPEVMGRVYDYVLTDK